METSGIKYKTALETPSNIAFSLAQIIQFEYFFKNLKLIKTHEALLNAQVQKSINIHIATHQKEANLFSHNGQ